MRISVPEIRNVAAVINNNLRQRNTLFLNMIRDINDVTSNNSLSGPGYDSVKKLFKVAYIGVAYGCMQVNQLIMTANVNVVNKLASTGIETIDTDDLSNLLARVNSLNEEMNRVTRTSYVIKGITNDLLVRGPDHSAEINRINDVIRKINKLVEEDAQAVSLYNDALAKLTDVSSAINKIKQITYSPSTKQFDYSLSEFDSFTKLFKDGDNIIMPREFFTGLSSIEEKEMNDLIGKTFSDLVGLGVISIDFKKDLENTKSNNVSQDNWEDIHNMTIEEWILKYKDGIANTYNGWTENGDYVKYPPTVDQGIYVTPSGITVPYLWQRAYDDPYAGSSLNYEGCGPTAAAMLISGITGKYTTPIDVMKSVKKIGNVVAWEGYNEIEDAYKTSVSIEGSGTHIYGLSKVIDTYGLKSKIVGIMTDQSQLSTSLDKGNIAIIHISGSRETSSGASTNYLDGNGGHYVTAYKGSNDGMVMILDPNNPANNVEVSYDTLSKICRTEVSGDMNVILVEKGD